MATSSSASLPPFGDRRVDRRTAIAWMLSAAAALPARRLRGSPADSAGDPPPPSGGYGTDPDLTRSYHPGELWPLTLDSTGRRAAGALCDLIIPADAISPSATQVGVVDFLDEWISAPYPDQRRDREIILGGLTWIDAEAQKRFGRDFSDLIHSEKTAIADAICHEPTAAPELRTASRFFAKFRNLTAGGFYTAPAGWKDLGYVGNVPLAAFPGPPPAVLRQAGLTPA